MLNSNGRLGLNKQMQQSQFNPKIDVDGIIMCHERFVNADLLEETKTPILMSRNSSPPSRKLSQETVPCRCKPYTSPDQNINWIEKGRDILKKIIQQCTLSQKYQGGPFRMLIMSPWLKIKVVKSKLFQSTGLH